MQDFNIFLNLSDKKIVADLILLFFGSFGPFNTEMGTSCGETLDGMFWLRVVGGQPVT